MVIFRGFVAIIAFATLIFLHGCVSDSQQNSAPSSTSADAAKAADNINSPQNAPADSVKDPVCGMTVDLKSPNIEKSSYRGVAYYFCSESCRKSFEANPEKYIQKSAETGRSESHMKE